MDTDTILLVEADAGHASVIARHLESRNFKLKLCSSVSHVNAIIESGLPGFLMIDLNAGGPFFFDFYNWLTSNPHRASIPRLFIADAAQKETAEKLAGSYNESIFYKPLDINLLISELYNRKTALNTGIIRRNGDYLSTLVGRRIGPAVIREELGRGGMGAVFLGFQESLNREVAIKVLLPGMVGDPTAIERFKREAQATARLKSPHVVQIFDFDELEDQTFYIVMEYLPGETIEAALERVGRFSLARAFAIILQVARGLTVAHNAGLVHRDIKPSNIIISKLDHATITDFGLVRQQDKIKQTQTGILPGSPHYLSPEQVSNETVDSRSDIYSLGIVFYQMLTGHPPFNANSVVEILMKHLEAPLPDPRNTVPDLPAEVVDLLHNMTAKKRAQRYGACHQLFTDLEELNRKYSLSRELRTDPNRGTIPELNENIDIDSAFRDNFNRLNRDFPALLRPDKLQGTVILSHTGTIREQHGDVPELTKNTLFILYESAKQLNAAVLLGDFHFILLTTREEIMVIFSHHKSRTPSAPVVDTIDINDLGIMLFKQNMPSMSSVSPQKQTGGLFKSESAGSPIRQLASTAGVREVLLFDFNGQLADHSLEKQEDRERYNLHFSPVSQIIASIALPLVELDIRFDDGRLLIWKLQTGILFVKTDVALNKSFVSILVSSQLEHLNAMTGTMPLPTVSVSSHSQQPDAAVPAELLQMLQVELARQVGPIARVLIPKEIKELGFTVDNLPEKMLPKLAQKLSQKVNEDKRKQFLETIEDLRFGFADGRK